MPTCRDCKQEVEEIVKYSTKCRSCTKEDAHWRHIKASYNMSKNEWLALYESQNGGCAICGCGNYEDIKGNRLSVDHSHPHGETRNAGKVKKHQIRGLLCHSCNTALGCFKHDIKLFTKAVEYLNKSLP
jgi:hypothetical protein